MSKFNELINGNSPVLVDFFAEWCGPCKMMAPILKDVKSELKDSIKIIKIDIDKNQRVAQVYGVRGVPTLVLFRNGQQIWRQSGVIPTEQLVSILRQKL